MRSWQVALVLALPASAQVPSVPLPSRPGLVWVHANDGAILVSYARDGIWLYGSTVGGPFVFHADSITMAAWADSAAAMRSSEAPAARASSYDSLIDANVDLSVMRLTDDSTAPYVCTVTVDRWRGVMVLPFDSAQRLFVLMRGKPNPLPSAPAPAGETYFDFQVEKQAWPLPTSGQAMYPEPVRMANLSGQVLAQFVVDTSGLVDIPTFKTLKATNPWFTASVWDVLPKLRFKPAQIKGQKVRELIQQPYAFNLHP